MDFGGRIAIFTGILTSIIVIIRLMVGISRQLAEKRLVLKKLETADIEIQKKTHELVAVREDVKIKRSTLEAAELEIEKKELEIEKYELELEKLKDEQLVLKGRQALIDSSRIENRKGRRIKRYTALITILLVSLAGYAAPMVFPKFFEDPRFVDLVENLENRLLSKKKQVEELQAEDSKKQQQINDLEKQINIQDMLLANNLDSLEAISKRNQNLTNRFKSYEEEQKSKWNNLKKQYDSLVLVIDHANKDLINTRETNKILSDSLFEADSLLKLCEKCLEKPLKSRSTFYFTKLLSKPVDTLFIEELSTDSIPMKVRFYISVSNDTEPFKRWKPPVRKLETLSNSGVLIEKHDIEESKVRRRNRKAGSPDTNKSKYSDQKYEIQLLIESDIFKNRDQAFVQLFPLSRKRYIVVYIDPKAFRKPLTLK